ncbi:hypothetical protein EMPS_11087 [Entomortierella parvispora]|uniref:Uncharacterized protein n=1 Tax=Entomortierella parvispora TaxID=205924 RepID=A0A9P3M1W5_9FUNG|nr:hypothetical protein EMPS_11087 [Entomortierella parvispora]
MSFGKTMEILAQVANVVVAFVQSEWFVSAHDTKTTDMGGRDSGNLYIMSNQAKGVHFNWMAERGPASDRLYSYASSGNSFKSTVEAMKGLGDGYYVQIVFQPVGTNH